MAMHQRWTLHVEQFARFQQADIELRPLTLFVGENNSGKSYMATLLWGLLALGRTVFPTGAPSTKTYKACQSRLMASMSAAVNSPIADGSLGSGSWRNTLNFQEDTIRYLRFQAGLMNKAGGS